VAVALVAAGGLTPLPAAAATAPRGSTAGLVIWLDTQGDGAAGSTYHSLHLTNLSGRACTLRGYPSVAAAALGGGSLGSPASRNPAHPARLVTLAPGASATAVLQIASADNYPRATCRQRTAAGLSVTPPGGAGAQRVPFPFLACARRGPSFLTVQAVEKA
jgi:hypothetical protein